MRSAELGFYRAEVDVRTEGRGTYELTNHVQSKLGTTGIVDGICNLFIHHTSASLMITENADPAVLRDLERWVSRLVPDGDALFEHRAEGPDDMPAHVRTLLTQTSLTIPVVKGELALGTWQGIYVWEHRTSPHRRRVSLSCFGTSS